jgi:hypothetical protein
MAQANSTPIQLYYSNTAGVSPTSANLISGELAINVMDGKLFYKDGSNNVNTIATAASAAGYFPKITFTNDATEQVTASAPWAWTNASFTQANTANTLARAAYIQANAANALAISSYAQANATNSLTTASYVQANAANTLAVSSYVQANAANSLAIAAFTKANAAMTIGTVDGSNNIVSTVLGVHTLRFETDSGFDVLQIADGVAKVIINSTFKYWEVDGQSTIIASGLDTIKFKTGGGIQITTDANAPKSITFTDNATFTQANAATVSAQAAYDKANVVNTYSFAAYSKANTVNTYAQAAFAQANVVLYLQSVNDYQNNYLSGSTVSYQAAYDQANAATESAQNAYNTANTASASATHAELVNNAQNTTISAVNTFGAGAYSRANQASIYAAAAFNAANVAPTGYLQANAATESAQAAYNSSNSYSEFISAAYSQANTTTNTTITLQNVNSYQNTYASAAYGKANASNTLAAAAFVQANAAATSYVQANAANVLAQAAYNAVNTIVIFGNTSPLGTNTTGLLVSNAVTLTTTTTVTDGLSKLNQILGKLVPNSPATFPSTYGTLTINSTVGPYRMTNFSQTDNTGTGTASVSGGTSVSPLRTASYTTSTITNINTIVGDVITAYKNGSSAGSRTITEGATNAGTYTDLAILANPDYSTVTGIAPNFWYSANIRATGTVSAGWNNIYITDTNGSPTSTVAWYYDNSAPGTPTFSSVSIVPLSPSYTYSSTVPHYNSSSTFKLGVDVSKLSGDMYPTSDTFFTGTAGGAFAAPSSNTYSAVGITTPLARNLYVSSGSVTVNTTASIISGFGSSSTGPSVSVNNSYNSGSQAFTTALANTILYKTGTATAIEETSIAFGTTVGSGSGLAARIINPGTTDTPTYTASASLFDSQNSTLTANDATIVAATLKHDQTNYASGYLPVGPNLSTGRTGAQYFTFRFVRTSVSKFDIKFTGTIAGLWVALPGSVIDTTSSINGWMSMSTAYAGSGHPGVNSGGNGSNGCALGGVVTLNTLVTNGSYTCTFGDVSSSSTSTNEIYVRIKLTSGQTVSALTLQSPSH